MAMTKKERAEFDAALERAELLAALRWTSAVEPDVQKPEPFAGAVSGFVFNAYSGSISPAWTESNVHGLGSARRSIGASASQGGIALYSTRERALRALRNEVERKAARELLRIDRELAKETK